MLFTLTFDIISGFFISYPDINQSQLTLVIWFLAKIHICLLSNQRLAIIYTSVTCRYDILLLTNNYGVLAEYFDVFAFYKGICD